MPRIGGRKLHHLLRQTLLKSGHISLGRDRLFDLLRQNDMLIERRPKFVKTTNSNHPFKKYGNLILGQPITRPNQVWVSDITYVRMNNGFAYISLITDLFSKRIVGYHASTSLELKGCIKALNMALRQGKPEIHHSDRGSQYCSYQYTSILKKQKTKISMADAGNCYQNAVAERVNGILKEEFKLNATFENLNQITKVLQQSVEIYNTKRPHWSLNLETPEKAYRAA
jgi:transposase InsO family protein